MALENWKIYAKDRKFEYFSDSKEEEWGGPFFFIQGADIQFGLISRELDKDIVLTWDKEKVLAENFVKRINQMNPKPKFLAMCGDLCDAMPDTDPEIRKKQEFDYKRIFGKLDKSIPLINVCGNHDVGNTPTPETVKMYETSFGNDYYSFWCGGLLFLVINSQYFFDSSKVPELAERHSQWIDQKLEEAERKKKRVVVFQHIPWFLNNANEDASYFTLNVDLRKKWLSKFKKAGVEAIFCGHYHRNAGGSYDGIDMVVTSAVGAGEKYNDETVKELESLKGIHAEIKNDKDNGEISFSKSQTSVFSDVNGRKTGHKEINNEVDKNGIMFAKLSQKIDVLKNKEEAPKSEIKTEIEIPSKGIHHIIRNDENMETGQEKKENENVEFKRARNGIDKMNSFSEIKYSPHDMAEYIFWTGDEKGVALTIEEFLREGLMTRQEAITFLQSIKYNLDIMQAHYQGLEKSDGKVSTKDRTSMKRKIGKFVEKSKENLYDEEQENVKLPPVDLLSVKSGSSEVLLTDAKPSFYVDQMNAGNGESNGQDYFQAKNKSYPKASVVSNALERGSVNEDEYDEIMEKLRVTGLLQKEYSLEEVIFELAKIMFSESLNKGNAEAQKAMQRFSAFLQTEVERGQVSRNLQKKILDILLSALMDALSEHPELRNRPTELLQVMLNQNSPTSDALRQLLMLGSKRLEDQSETKEGLSEKTLLLGKKKLPKRLQ